MITVPKLSDELPLHLTSYLCEMNQKEEVTILTLTLNSMNSINGIKKTCPYVMTYFHYINYTNELGIAGLEINRE